MHRPGWAARAIAGAICSCCAMPAAADLFTLDGGAELREEYNTNWRLTSLPHDSVFITTAIGTLAASRETETSRTSLAATLKPYVVTGESGANRIDGSFSANTRHFLERQELSAAFLFTRSSLILTQLQQTGVLLTQTPQNLYSFTPGWTYALDERTKARLAYTFSAARYPDPPPGQFDYDNQQASLTLTRNFSPTIDGFVTASQSRFDTIPSANQTTSTQVSVGASGSFTERLTGSLAIGGYQTTVRSTQSFLVCPGPIADCLSGAIPIVPVRSDQRSSNQGYSFDGSLAWRQSERTTWSGLLSQSLQPSGSGAVYLVWRAGASVTHDFHERLSAQAGVAAIDSRLAGTSERLGEQRTYSASANLAWRATRNWRIVGGVQGTRVEFSSSQESVDGIAVFLSAGYVWDGVSISR